MWFLSYAVGLFFMTAYPFSSWEDEVSSLSIFYLRWLQLSLFPEITVDLLGLISQGLFTGLWSLMSYHEVDPHKLFTADKELIYSLVDFS